MEFPRNRFAFLALLAIAALGPVARTAAGDETPSLPPATIASRSAHERLWRRTVIETNLLNGRVLRQDRDYSELATGICRWDEASASWVDASSEVEILNGVPVARNTQHKVTFPANLTAGPIDLLMPDGQRRLKTALAALSYYDPAGQQNAIIAQVRASTAVVSGNTVTFPDCFNGIRGSVIYENKLGSFSQSIIIEAQIPAPSAFGLPDNSQLEIYSEVLEAPASTTTPRLIRGTDAIDDTVDFSSMLIGRGKAFLLDEEAHGPVTIFKTWTLIDQRLWLIEGCDYLRIKPHLDTLPPLAAAPKPKADQLLATAPGQFVVPPLAGRAMPPPRHWEDPGAKPQMAAVRPKSPGLLLDFEVINAGSTNTYYFRAGRTYHITAQVSLNPPNGSPSAVFEPNCVLKYAKTNNASIYFYANPSFGSSNYGRIYCTASDDNSVGETITGSTGTPSGFYANPAFWGGWSEDYHHIWFAYANKAIHFEDDVARVRHCQFIHCNTAIDGYAGWEAVSLDNCLFYDIGTAFYGGYLQVDARHLTINGCTNLTAGATSPSNLKLTNSLLIAITNDGNFTLTTDAVARDIFFRHLNQPRWLRPLSRRQLDQSECGHHEHRQPPDRTATTHNLSAHRLRISCPSHQHEPLSDRSARYRCPGSRVPLRNN